MKRRTFLQRVGSTLAALGVTEAGWLTLGNRYYQALAQSSPRKLALLVGINQYPQTQPLSGCLVDVQLQRELLMHRFGFQNADILTLTEEQATRQNIETAFVEHLTKQATADDLVVFHFSGYGSRIQLGESPETLQNALIPVDGIHESQDSKIVNYLLAETLQLLLRKLPTSHVIAVLDTSYNAPNTIWQGGLKIRARPELVLAKLNPEEIDLQNQLRTAVNNSVTPENPGLWLASASNANQMAGEALMSGFSAGLFTYALTQSLWEATPATTIQVSLNHAATSVQQLGGKQQPGLLDGQKNQHKIPINDFFLPNSSAAEGVITAVEDDGKTAQLWLAGLPLQVLENYGVNSRFVLVTPEDASPQMILRYAGGVKLRLSRTGLTAKGQIVSNEGMEEIPSLQVGQLVQETVRLLPRNISLTVALDTALERIERVDATSAFANVPHVYSTVAGEQPADYVFGKVREVKTVDLLASASLAVSASRYGLFSLGQELIPNTAGAAGEAVKLAVQRCSAKLQTLLAAKIWRLTANEGSSRLGVKASLEIASGISRTVTQRETLRPLTLPNSNPKILSTQQRQFPQRGEPPHGTGSSALRTFASIPTVPVGSRIQYRVQNTGTRPLYLMLLGLDSSRSAIALYPWTASMEPLNSPGNTPLRPDVVVPPGATITVPQNTAGSEWVIQGPNFVCETQLICSTSPFTQTLAALAANKHPIVAQQRIYPLTNPTEVAVALLQDLHNASDAKTEVNGAASDAYVLDVNNWATLSFVYQVV